MVTNFEFLSVIFYVLISGLYIGLAINSFRDKRFIVFGVESMWALLFAVSMIVRVISWLA